MHEVIFLGLFLVFIVALLALDLGVLNRQAHVISLKESTIYTLAWIFLALVFFVFLRYFGHWIHGIEDMQTLEAVNVRNGHKIAFIEGADFATNLQLYRNQLSLEYLTGYLIEKAMSLDNIFVILMIFTSFGVERKLYHKVLFWGIIGAVVMRFLFIFAISGLVHQFEWVLAVFGVILVFTALKMMTERNKDEKIDVENHKLVKFVSKHFSVTPDFRGERFFAKDNGKWMLTPLFVVLLVIEFSDVIFAVDSVPAIFSITQDQYIVFFSNIFAILGLRSLFFMLSGIVTMFRFLKQGLGVLLAFIGVKMILEVFNLVHISTGLSLIIILSVLVACILLSVIFPEKKTKSI